MHVFPATHSHFEWSFPAQEWAQVFARGWSYHPDRHGRRLRPQAHECVRHLRAHFQALCNPFHDPTAATHHFRVRVQHVEETFLPQRGISAGLFVPGDFHRHHFLKLDVLLMWLDRLGLRIQYARQLGIWVPHLCH